jgi:hypothetical protein
MISDYLLEDYDYDHYSRPVSLHDVVAENWSVSNDAPEKVANKVQQTPKSNSTLVTSRIRVALSRPLTWAEKEELETDYSDPDLRRINGRTDKFKVSVSKERTHVWAEAAYGSRILFELVAASLENNFVNVFPIAVRTFREYNG